MPPRHEHDCAACVYQGHMQPFDVYLHPGGSVVLRYGKDGEYYSLPSFDYLRRFGWRGDSLWVGVEEFINNKNME